MTDREFYMILDIFLVISGFFCTIAGIWLLYGAAAAITSYGVIAVALFVLRASYLS